MARRRQRIIEDATAVLTERGPAALPLDEIAERAGVSRRTVFNYFHSVEDLLVAVGADMLGGVIASLQVNAPAPSEVPDPHAPGPLAFADPDYVRPILEDAGWREVTFEAHDFATVVGAGPDPLGDAACRQERPEGRGDDLPDGDGAARLMGCRQEAGSCAIGAI